MHLSFIGNPGSQRIKNLWGPFIHPPIHNNGGTARRGGNPA